MVEVVGHGAIGRQAIWRRPNKNKTGYRVTRCKIVGTVPSGYFVIEWFRRYKNVYEIVKPENVTVLA